MPRPNHFSGDDAWEENTRAGLDEDFEWTPVDSVADRGVPAPSSERPYIDRLADTVGLARRFTPAGYATWQAEFDAALDELVAHAREPQSYREKRLVEKWGAAEARVAELEAALREAEAVLIEIASKPYRAEEATANYFERRRLAALAGAGGSG